MSKPMLPALTLRETRVRLLAWTLEDALLGGTLDGGGQDSATARLNLHPELWTQGSYQEFERALDSATRRVRRFVRRQYVETPLRLQPQQLTPELKQVTALMPRNIYVPVDVAVAAGYLEGQAGYFEIPRSERLRRFHRTPLRHETRLRLGCELPYGLTGDAGGARDLGVGVSTTFGL